MQFFIFLFFPFVMLSGCFFDTHIPEKSSAQLLYSEFVKPGTFSPDYHSLKEDFDLLFNAADIEWEKEKGIFHVHFYDIFDGDEYVRSEYILSLPQDSSEALIYMVYSIDAGGLDAKRYDFERCMEKNIKERISTVYDRCRKKIPMPQVLIDKMKSFLLDDKQSILSRGNDCILSLNMFIFNGEKYHYFDMPRPTCIDDNMKKDPRITEYIEFYNEMAAFIKQDFSECRWDNFGNKEKMIRECGKFNWRWKKQYPDLVK